MRNSDRTRKIIDVQIGQVTVGRGKVILQSKAIGSCIAICAYDVTKNIGSLAHVMLPGVAPAKKASERTKYASDAIDTIVSQMAQQGSKNNDIEVVLVGGGNVLNRENDTICQANIESVTQILKEKGIPIKATALGGTERKSVSIDIEKGRISFIEGDGNEKVLWVIEEGMKND